MDLSLPEEWKQLRQPTITRYIVSTTQYCLAETGHLSYQISGVYWCVTCKEGVTALKSYEILGGFLQIQWKYASLYTRQTGRLI